jgi:hypothetical protein
MQAQYECLQNRINIELRGYNTKVAACNAVLRQNKTPQKDIAFKADEGKDPVVKF